jgi:SOS response regulatory protein OraA/RecX
MSQRLQPKLDRAELQNYALRALGRKSLSVAELRRKLLQKAALAGDADVVIGALQSYGYLNDQRLSEGFAEVRAQSGGVGEQRVLRDLLKKRVAPGVARQAVSQAFANVDEPALVRDFLRRKLRGKDLHEYLKEPKNLASLYRKLRVAGFSSTASIRALKTYSAQADELESFESASAEDES